MRAFSGPGGKWQISTDGGAQPLWPKTAGEIFYRNGERLLAVPVRMQPTFQPGTPPQLFVGRYLSFTGPFRTYDVTPDGKRFLLIRNKEAELAASQLTVALHWSTELRQRVPLKK